MFLIASKKSGTFKKPMFLVTSSLLQLANVFEAEMNANPLHIEHKTILETF